MPPTMRTRGVGRHAAESLGGGMGVRVGKGGRGRRPREGNDERVDDLNDQGNDQGMGANEGIEGENVRNVLVNGKRNAQDMSGCSINQKVKYTAGSFVGKALTWWNSQIHTISQEVVVSMSWNDFKFMMIEEFCPSHEMQKLEIELWNHAMVGAGDVAYTDRFHELVRLAPHLVTPKSRKIERYMYGLASKILRIVAATKPKTMQKAVQISGALTNDVVRNGSIKKVEKRGNVGEPSKDKNGRDDNKRTRTGNVFATIVNPVGRENAGAWPKCTTYNSYHAPGGPCRTCFNCNCPGYLEKDCRGVPRNMNPVNTRNPHGRVWVNERQMQTTEEKVDMSKALDASSVNTESNIITIYDEEPMAEVQMTAEINVFAIGQQHSEQPEFNNEGEVVQNAEECHDTYPFPAIVMRAKTGEHTISLTTTNDKFKDQLQEKGFAIAALKNELRKSTGNSVNTKFAQSSILGKPMSQPLRNQSVVRQPTAFKSERPRFSKPRCDSQVDVHNNLSKPVTTHYFTKEREAASAKPHHMIASSNSRIRSRNMLKFSSNDMVHNHYLEEAKKKTQERSRNSEPSLMPSAITKSTANGSKPMPRRNTQTSRNWPTTKNSFVMTKTVPIAEHSRNSRYFSDSKHFVCSTCQKCVFSANHDSCVTKFLKEVNSRAKVSSNKTTNKNKPVEQKGVPHKQERHIPIGHRFSIQNTFVVKKKTMTLRSCLSWKPTGKIFKTVGLRWVPTRKIFASSTTKVDSEPLIGLNADITNQYECEQTLDVSAGTLNLSAGTSFNPQEEGLKVWLLKR
nr:reverse transcriptase domain-containing protein [Tanacetum cinerariifolium]